MSIGAKRSAKAEVLLRREMLVAEEHDAVFAKGAADLGKNLVRQRRSQIDPGNLGPDLARNRLDPDMLVAHLILPNGARIIEPGPDG